MKYIKIYGLQRSGTNYVKALLETNFECRVLQNIGGWKHECIDGRFLSSGFVTDIPRNEVKVIETNMRAMQIPMIHVYRDPKAWVVDYREYLASKNEIIPQMWWLMETYNYKNQHWRRSCDFSACHDKLVTPEAMGVLTTIKEMFNLKQRNDKLIPFVDERMKRGGDKGLETIIQKGTKFDRSYITEKRYLSKLTTDEVVNIDRLNIFDPSSDNFIKGFSEKEKKEMLGFDDDILMSV